MSSEADMEKLFTKLRKWPFHEAQSLIQAVVLDDGSDYASYLAKVHSTLLKVGWTFEEYNAACLVKPESASAAVKSQFWKSVRNLK